MSRTLLVRFSAAAVALGCAWIAYTQAPPAPQGKQQANNTITKVTDDLYAIIGDGNGGLWVNQNVVNKLDQIMAELKN